MIKTISIGWLKKEEACKEAIEKYAPSLNGGPRLCSACIFEKITGERPSVINYEDRSSTRRSVFQKRHA